MTGFNGAPIARGLAAVAVCSALSGPILALPALVWPVRAAAADCAAVLTQDEQRWRDAGFAAPAKPTQAIVPARSGASVTGPRYAWMAATLRYAAAACRAGQTGPALSALASLDDVLGVGQ